MDLEFGCSLPIDLRLTPYWLTNQDVDRLMSVEYNVVRRESKDASVEEE